MASDKAQLNRHVHFKKTLEDVGDVVVDVERGLVEDTGKYLNKAIAFIKIDYFTNNNIPMFHKVYLSMHYTSFL